MTAPGDRREDHHDDDEVFRQIVAGFADEPSEPVPRWPVWEDVGSGSDTDTDTGSDTDTDTGTGTDLGEEPPRDTPATEEGLPGWLEPAALEDEGHFEPPPPPKLPRVRLRTVGGVLVLLCGLAVLLAPYQVGLDDTPGSLIIGVLLVVGGGILLLGSMRDAPGSDDRPDDGAVV